jgi:AcrR family transcriptional regulator
MTTKPTRYHHGDLKAALINSAAAMLEEEGPEAISFRAIARAVGVSQTAPYNHFRSKEHLLATLAASGFRELLTREIEAGKRARTPATRIVKLGCAYVGFARTHPQLYRLMFGVGILDWRTYPELAEAAHASYAPVVAALAAHLGVAEDADESVETASITAWALVHGLSMLFIDNKIDSAKIGPGGVEALTERVTSSIVTGFASQMSRSQPRS